MPRQLRTKSDSGIYHVILRGVNRQRIFEYVKDYQTLFRIIQHAQWTDLEQNQVTDPNFYLYAYCLMDNHIHLLIQPDHQELGRIITRISTTYAQYFNNTYERVGHLFQDRYKSEPVDTIQYFYTLVDYIHNNPVKAGVTHTPERYPFSSFHELAPNTYRLGDNTAVDNLHLPPICIYPAICSISGVEEAQRLYMEKVRLWRVNQSLGLPRCPAMMSLGVSRKEIEEYVSGGSVRKRVSPVDMFRDYLQGKTDALSAYLRVRLHWQTAEEKDGVVVETILELTGAKSISEFQQLDKTTMRTALAAVRDSGVPVAVISRLTGVAYGIIRRAKVTN